MSTRSFRAREAALQHQFGLCYYCKLPLITQSIGTIQTLLGLTPKLAQRLQCTAEHLVPRSEGGSFGRANIVAACYFCNQTRHKFKNPPSPEMYAVHVQKRVTAGRWHPQEIHRAAKRLSAPRVA